MVVSEIKRSYIKDGVQYVQAELISDTKIPKSDFPETGEDIDGLSASEHLAPGSVIMTPSFDIAMRGEDGWGDWQ